jgi:hypothetical protein
MPDVVGQQYNYINNHLKQVKVLEELFPNNTIIGYRKCHELVLVPKKSQGYAMVG